MEPTQPARTPNAKDDWFPLPELDDRSKAYCKDYLPGRAASEQTHPVAGPENRSPNQELSDVQHPDDWQRNPTVAFPGDNILSPNKAQSPARTFPTFQDSVIGSPASAVTFSTGEASTGKEAPGPVHPLSILKKPQKPAYDFTSSPNFSSSPNSPPSPPVSIIPPRKEERPFPPPTTAGAESTVQAPEAGGTDVSTELDEDTAVVEGERGTVKAGGTNTFSTLRARQSYTEQQAIPDQYASPGALQQPVESLQPDDENQCTSLPSDSGKPSMLKKLLLGQSAVSPYWRTLTTDDTASIPEDQPENTSARANASTKATGNTHSTGSSDEGADFEVGTVKKVLLVPTPTASVIDDTAAATHDLHSGVFSVVGIDDDGSPNLTPGIDFPLQSSTGIQFRQVKPERRSKLWASSRWRDGVTLSEDGRDITTLRNTFTLARFTALMSTAFRAVIVVMTTSRLFMLIIFGLATMMPSFQWIQYSIVSNLMQRYYDISSDTVRWTSMIFHVGYMTLIFPCAWILDNYGLRVTLLCSSCLSAIGSCIKLFSVAPDRFSLVLIGQTFQAFATAFTAILPTRLASVWFEYDEQSSASSAAMLGLQLGTALGFFVPPHVIKADNVEGSLRMLCIAVSAVSCLALLVSIVAFEEKPEHPLSLSETLNLNARAKPPFKEEMHSLLGDRDFLLLLFSYGLNVGCFYSIATLLNPVILAYFPDEASFAGLLGLSMVLSGVLGGWVGGIVADKTCMFKEVTLAVYISSAVGLLLFAALLPIRSHAVTMIVGLFLGFFMMAYLPLGMQLGAEMTYPLSEGLPASFMVISAQGMGLVLIPICAGIQAEFGVVAANGFMTAVLAIGCSMTAILRAELKRQNAFKREQRKRSRSSSVPTASDQTPSPGDEEPEL